MRMSGSITSNLEIRANSVASDEGISTSKVYERIGSEYESANSAAISEVVESEGLTMREPHINRDLTSLEGNRLYPSEVRDMIDYLDEHFPYLDSRDAEDIVSRISSLENRKLNMERVCWKSEATLLKVRIKKGRICLAQVSPANSNLLSLMRTMRLLVELSLKQWKRHGRNGVGLRLNGKVRDEV